MLKYELSKLNTFITSQRHDKKELFRALMFIIRRMNQGHTILLVQPGVQQDTRTYTDFDNVNACLEVSESQ